LERPVVVSELTDADDPNHEADGLYLGPDNDGRHQVKVRDLTRRRTREVLAHEAAHCAQREQSGSRFMAHKSVIVEVERRAHKVGWQLEMADRLAEVRANLSAVRAKLELDAELVETVRARRP
jgi:hypothetical protein